MSILGKIFGKLFPGAHAQQAPAPTGTATPTPTQPQGTAPGATQSAGTPTATMQQVDIEKQLDDLAAKNSQKLNWRNSIVDLMKLVGMDSTLQERRELADELGYSGDKQDTAAMNMWLHKQVMKKMAENGGKVPANLMD
jgi:hypothetical protein